MNAMPPRDLTRRAFARQACCAALGATGILSTLAQLRVMGAVAADALPGRAAAIPGDFKALVGLFLHGGNDGANVILPSDASSYATYSRARAEVAVAQSGLLPITPRSYSDERTYAFHSAVPGMQSLFNQGKLAVLANVGTLLQPTTLAQYNSGKALPPQLFSHLDQYTQWQSSISDRPFETGWGGRLADLLDALNANHEISMCISLNGASSFQRGRNVTELAVGSGGGAAGLITGLGTGNVPTLRFNALRNILSANRPNLLDAAFAQTTLKAHNDNTLLNSILPKAPVLSTVFPNTPTAASLAGVAKLISIASELGLKRQIFFVELRGFDLHAGQVSAHAPLLTELSAALAAFYNATVELGVANQVTTFTASDFGRTYVPNAGGTDHGWGNHQFIMGGAVQGGDIYGTMPSLAVNGPDDTGRGRWIPSTSVDEYHATLATWFGVSAANLSTVLPNIGRFSRSNLGFMG